MAKRPCARVGCPNLVVKGYCESCAVQHTSLKKADLRRPSAAKRGYGRRWQAAREHYFRGNPLCVDPYGIHGARFVVADELDHIDPHRGDMVKFWDQANWQGLCRACHSRKTATEESSFAACTSTRHAQAAADRLGRTIDRRY